MVVKMSIVVFGIVTPCGVVHGSRRVYLEGEVATAETLLTTCKVTRRHVQGEHDRQNV